MVELAAVGDPASVPAAIATVLGITPQGDTPLIDTVAESLGGRQLLLVMDNCEHVLAAASSAVATILDRSRNVKILATSREALAVDGETVLTVAPLALEGGVTSDAVTLFVDRARAARPDFGLREPDTGAAVIDICTALDGLPLGIELAAARMAAMSAVEVRDRLADRFRLLQGVDARARNDSSRSTMRWRGPTTSSPTTSASSSASRRSSRAASTSRASARWSTAVTTSTFSGTSTRSYGSRSSSPTTSRPALATASSRPSASSPSTAWPRRARSTRLAIVTPSTSRSSRSRDGHIGTGPGGATRSTGSRRSWATCAPDTSGARRAARWRWPPTSRPTPR